MTAWWCAATPSASFRLARLCAGGCNAVGPCLARCPSGVKYGYFRGVVRFRRAGRGCAHAADRRLSAWRRSPRALHHRRDRRWADRRSWSGLSLPLARWTGGGEGHLPHLHVLAIPGARRGRRAGPGAEKQAIAYVNDVGLLSEEVDPQSGKLLGNYPQAFGHIELVNAAWAISQAEQAVRASAAVHGSPVKAIAVFPGQASKLDLRNVTEPGLEHSDLATSACRPGASRPRPASASGRSLRGECA